jgi:hypothetical protein
MIISACSLISKCQHHKDMYKLGSKFSWSPFNTIKMWQDSVLPHSRLRFELLGSAKKSKGKARKQVQNSCSTLVVWVIWYKLQVTVAYFHPWLKLPTWLLWRDQTWGLSRRHWAATNILATQHLEVRSLFPCLFFVTRIEQAKWPPFLICFTSAAETVCLNFVSKLWI